MSSEVEKRVDAEMDAADLVKSIRHYQRSRWLWLASALITLGFGFWYVSVIALVFCIGTHLMYRSLRKI